ncbi:hypothetical protein DPMN_093005 [Dreissena polymorpha]|uniref:Uncharacterized protein n=1 Tax=Dreissena polymorpha TaxID=45954 RepID=A0A9D4L2M4_DREPO|nr:hypothetical protein DPMN_093005 [Dreissena polymorpha]
MYGVPEKTLRDIIKGKINPEGVTTGREPVLSMLEEAQIVEHLKIMAQYGYGYTKQETVDIATDFAIQLCKRTKEQPLTLTLFEGFRNRWPEKNVQKPSLERVRANMANEAVVKQHFASLSQTLSKHKPQPIFNVDEKVISMDHSPSHGVYASTKS